MNTNFPPYLVLTAAMLILAYYFMPFMISGLIMFVSRRKGRKIGAKQNNKIVMYFGADMKNDENEGLNDRRKDLFNQIQQMAQDIIAKEHNRLNLKYNSQIQQLQTRIDSIMASKNKILHRIKTPDLVQNVRNQGKMDLEESAFAPRFRVVTCIIYMVILLLILVFLQG